MPIFDFKKYKVSIRASFLKKEALNERRTILESQNDQDEEQVKTDLIIRRIDAMSRT